MAEKLEETRLITRRDFLRKMGKAAAAAAGVAVLGPQVLSPQREVEAANSHYQQDRERSPESLHRLPSVDRVVQAIELIAPPYYIEMLNNGYTPPTITFSDQGETSREPTTYEVLALIQDPDGRNAYILVEPDGSLMLRKSFPEDTPKFPNYQHPNNKRLWDKFLNYSSRTYNPNDPRHSTLIPPYDGLKGEISISSQNAYNDWPWLWLRRNLREGYSDVPNLSESPFPEIHHKLGDFPVTSVLFPTQHQDPTNDRGVHVLQLQVVPGGYNRRQDLRAIYYNCTQSERRLTPDPNRNPFTIIHTGKNPYNGYNLTVRNGEQSVYGPNLNFDQMVRNLTNALQEDNSTDPEAMEVLIQALFLRNYSQSVIALIRSFFPELADKY